MPQNLTMSGPSSVTASFILPWYGLGGTWSNRKPITIDHTRVAGSTALTDFPLLVSVADPNLKAVLETRRDRKPKQIAISSRTNNQTGRISRPRCLITRRGEDARPALLRPRDKHQAVRRP